MIFERISFIKHIDLLVFYLWFYFWMFNNLYLLFFFLFFFICSLSNWLCSQVFSWIFQDIINLIFLFFWFWFLFHIVVFLYLARCRFIDIFLNQSSFLLNDFITRIFLWKHTAILIQISCFNCWINIGITTLLWLLKSNNLVRWIDIRKHWLKLLLKLNVLSVLINVLELRNLIGLLIWLIPVDVLVFRFLLLSIYNTFQVLNMSTALLHFNQIIMSGLIFCVESRIVYRFHF